MIGYGDYAPALIAGCTDEQTDIYKMGEAVILTKKKILTLRPTSINELFREVNQ